jgi:FMNH2-dependent dimethyl sulfone monooxygenase
MLIDRSDISVQPFLANPMRGPHPFKLGVFAANADRGLSFTTVPEQWRANWDDVQRAAVAADEGGMDFFLPIARWRGFGGTTHVREWSFETFTFAAALAAVTRRIALFSTVHVPLVHPIYAAKALATIDHISHGRSGLNIVCGWNPDEFDMFGVKLSQEAYKQAAEWSEILTRLYASAEPFDFNGAFYQLRGAISRPAALQAPRPVTMNAAFGAPGRDFAARCCDYLFTTFTDLEAGRAHVADIRERGTLAGREIGVYTVAHVVCRETERQALDYTHRYSVEFTDEAALDYHMRQKKGFSKSHEDRAFIEYRQRFAAGTGSFPLIGTPAQIVDQLLKMHGSGFAGAALSFVNYADELPFFCRHVLPLMREAGLRADADWALRAPRRCISPGHSEAPHSFQ